MTSAQSEEKGAARALRPPALEVGHVYLDVCGHRLYCLNETARRLHSEGVPFTPANLRSQPLYTPDGRAVAAADLPLVAAWRTGQPTEAIFELPREGATAWRLSWTGTPFFDSAGRVVGVIGTVQRHGPDPDWQVMAELAHDLRTPLQSLKMLGAVLERLPAGDPRLRQTLETFYATTDRAVQIALELAERARGPAQRGRTEGITWFGLEPFLERLAHEQALAAQSKGLILGTDFTAVRGWSVHTDRARLARILSNLLGNAIRYTSTGAVALKTSWQETPRGRALALEVMDTGPGIAPEEQESIFQPFERGRAGSEPDSGGSGLGLAVVDRLVKELALSIHVESERGRGSGFQLLLPAAILRQGPGG